MPREATDAVSKALRAQIAQALSELLRGLEGADREEQVHAGAVTAILRMVFVLLAEGRGLAPSPPDAAEETLHALHRALRAEARRTRALDDRRGAWGRVVAIFRRMHAREGAPGGLFDPRRHPLLDGEAARIPDGAVLRTLDRLAVVDGEPVAYGALDVEHLGAVHEGLMAFDGAPSGRPSEERRRLGAHYTSRALTEIVVARTLDPLLYDGMAPEEILALQVCDPAMGSGAFLLEACRRIARHLAAAWERRGTSPAHEDPPARARVLVARRCLHGVDRSALAVDLARLSLWLVAGAREEPLSFVDHALRLGDSLVGLPRAPVVGASIDLFTLAAVHAKSPPFDWPTELPEVFAEGRRGFDAIVGNPPWVSYAGRAAQPLDPDLRALYAATSPAFHGYRNLQGVFVHRAASLLRPGGRLGLVLPTSMSDLGGYEPSRRAHDELCVCDEALPDFGDRAFDDVFQPSMALLSTRRPAPVALDKVGPWPLARADLDDEARALLDALGALPTLPPHLFGERGFQTTGEDVRHLHALAGPEGALTTGVRVGGDVEPFLRRAPGLYCDPRAFGGRFRDEASFRAVKLLIRQTARWPMVALSDGQAFRNSILAGFSDEDHGAYLLLAYLNSAPIRWLHYMRQRDARQGMPQMKIAHLRALPAPPRGSPAVARLAQLGQAIGERNTGVRPGEQEQIDDLVAEALDLSASARARIAAWARAARA